MFVDYRGSITGIMQWQWRSVLLFIGAATAIYFAHGQTDLLNLPTFPLVVVGGAIGIFASFRTNAAYDRWWEGRKLWGRLVNASRHLSTQALTLLAPEDKAVGEEIVRRQVAYVHMLRVTLRGDDPRNDETLKSLMGTNLERVAAATSPTHTLVHLNAEAVAKLAADGRLDERRLQSFGNTFEELLGVQGGCERIKKTPFPRGYGYIAERLIQLYSIVLPMALVPELGWLTIPLNLVICLSFLLISEVGRVLEDPFTHFWPALPLSALSVTIERNLRERLGDADLPANPVQNDKGILM